MCNSGITLSSGIKCSNDFTSGDLCFKLSLFMQVFFNPEIYNSDFTTPLPVVIDKCIQSAPIDTRRALYKVNTQSGELLVKFLS